MGKPMKLCLNAPFGAQCFPTQYQRPNWVGLCRVSMHLLVLSAFRPGMTCGRLVGAPVSMHLLVLSAFRHSRRSRDANGGVAVSMHLLVLSAFRRESMGVVQTLAESLNAPFGAQCFPTEWQQLIRINKMSQCTFWCSVLSDAEASRRGDERSEGLNAPFGAQCFPTRTPRPRSHSPHRLNAPFGAQCFPT